MNKENFDDREIKMLYKENLQRTAPDMEKLWSRIESRLDETDKTDTLPRREISQTKKTNKMARLTAWAAAAVIIFSVGALVLNSNSPQKDTSDRPANNAGNTAPADNAEAAEPGSSRAEPVSYESLPLGHSGVRTAAYKPAGDEYFVESAVLSKAEVFADVRVTAAQEHEGFCRYTLQTVALYKEQETVPAQSRELILDSSSPLLLSTGGEYLLPLYEDSSGWHLAFENAPQIELTQDGRVVFHNGWKSLIEDSSECIYPENKYDEFFFDRMRIAPAENIETLIAVWRSLDV